MRDYSYNMLDTIITNSMSKCNECNKHHKNKDIVLVKGCTAICIFCLYKTEKNSHKDCKEIIK